MPRRFREVIHARPISRLTLVVTGFDYIATDQLNGRTIVSTRGSLMDIKNAALSNLTAADISRIVEMAWEDRTSFDAIEAQFGQSYT